MSALVITTAALASTICTTTREHYTATLQCPTGTVIKKVGFAVSDLLVWLVLLGLLALVALLVVDRRPC